MGWRWALVGGVAVLLASCGGAAPRARYVLVPAPLDAPNHCAPSPRAGEPVRPGERTLLTRTRDGEFVDPREQPDREGCARLCGSLVHPGERVASCHAARAELAHRCANYADCDDEPLREAVYCSRSVSEAAPRRPVRFRDGDALVVCKLARAE